LEENKNLIEKELYKKSLSLFKPQIRMVFYDLTTTYFESVNSDTLRAFGYSKDNKTDCVQILIGLIVSTEGIPLGYEIFAGNTYEGKTVINMLKKLKERYEIDKVIFVGDKGIMSRRVLSEIEEAGYEYIVSAKVKRVHERYHKKILDRKSYIKIGEGIYLSKLEIEGKRLVLGYSEERARRDKKMRELIIEKIGKNIDVSGISGVMKSQYKKYLNIQEKAKLDEEKIEEASRWDGYFGFYTNNRELSGKEVIKAYKLLWQVEDSFRSLKTTLKLRPIYHWTGNRIKGHIMMCFISLT
jgi:transposase